MRSKRTYIILLFLTLCSTLRGQDSTPVVQIWDKSDHRCSNQIWAAGCDSEGVMYFGNADGLLTFDSRYWEIHPLPSGNTVRSVLCVDDRIYTGSFEEFGYFTHSRTGELLYTPLSDNLQGYTMRNNEIWTILQWNNFILFHSFDTLFIYDPENDNVESFNTGSFLENIEIGANNRIFCSAYGFSEFDPVEKALTEIPHPWKSRMIGAVALNPASSLIVTLNEGIYSYSEGKFSKWHNECEDFLAEGHINRVFCDSRGNIIIGSSLNGAVSIDRKGHKNWAVDASNVLNGNTVLGICENRDGDVFLAMNSGICLVESNNGIRYIKEISAKPGAVYCAHYKAPYLYIGSNQGLYVGLLDSDCQSLADVRRVQDVQGPVMYLKDIDGQLICGTNGETFQLKGRSATPLSSGNAGGSCLAKGVINGREVLIEGTYTKLCLYVKENGKYIFKERIEGLIQPINSIDIDFSGTIWASHITRGLYRLKLSDDLSYIRGQQYFASLDKSRSSAKIKVGNIGGRTVFYDDQNVYTYDDMTDSIRLYSAVNDRLSGVKGIVNICPGERPNTYNIMNDNDVYLFDFGSEEAEEPQRLPYSIFSSASVDQSKEIVSGPDGYSILTLNNSLAFLKDLKQSTTTGSATLNLVQVRVGESDGNKFHLLNLDEKLEWKYKNRLVSLKYSFPQYQEISSRHLEYRLKGRDGFWRRSDANTVDLSYMKEGRYTLEARIVNDSGIVLGTNTTQFRIKPPFYRTWLAKCIYVLIILLILAGIALAIRHRIEVQKQMMEKQRLESELAAKSREITATTMSLLNKNKILMDLKEELSVQKGTLGQAYPDKYYKRMMEAIDSQISNDGDWKIFQENFDRIHGNFFTILKSRYPSLTDSDLRFCSYLCMNLSSKEIASMMNISLKGVEAARYRIRKKIGLPSEISLASFFMDLK